MLDKVLSEILPPLLYKAPARIRSRMPAPKGAQDVLFDGEDGLFKQLAASAKVYGEYGCGASTLWMASHTACRIFSVDTSDAWLDIVRQKAAGTGDVTLHHADLGAIGAWGRPVGYDSFQNFGDYTDWLWQQDASPDLVLVDGRFRACCFLTSLLHANEGANLVFDDYMDRPHYHFVERFAKPVQTCGRQAWFRAPGQGALDVAEVRQAIERFRFVMD